MLKRNGEPSASGTHDTLNRGEQDAYNEAFDEIRQELEALERIKTAVQALTKDPSVFAVPGGGPEVGSIIQIQSIPIDRWQICSTLLKLRNSQIFLCERCLHGAKEFAVIERFRSDSPYARANGEAEVLQAGDDPVLLVEEYGRAYTARHGQQSRGKGSQDCMGAIRKHESGASRSGDLREMCASCFTGGD
jgi:hypothetical protein